MALESALEHAVENIMENDPEYAQCIAYARARMCQGYYPQYFVDGVVQKQRGKYTNEDAYVFITLWTDLWTNKLSVTKIYVGSGPSCDLARLDNQKKLDDGLAKVKLSYTRINSTGETFTSRTNAQFSARVDLHQRQGQDGALCWSKDMGVSLNDGTRTTPLINCSPLEIGYMNASTGLYRLYGASVLARWAYDSKEIILFVYPDGDPRQNKIAEVLNSDDASTTTPGE